MAIRPAHLRSALCAVATTLAIPSVAHAHFILVSPLANQDQDDLGDPQKVPPCGDNGSASPTGEITVLQAGGTVTITIDETVPHPGHYRVSIAQTPEELPAEPLVTEGMQSDCGSVEIMNPAVMPVLADGLFVHDSAFSEQQTIEVQIPADFTCVNCTLQVLEFMSSHGAPCFYHHCATVTIEGGEATGSGPTTDDTASTTDDPTDPTDATATTDTAEDSTSDTAASATASGSASATATGSDDSSGGTATTLATGTDSASGGGGDDDDSGCGCTSTRPASSGWLALVAIGLLRGRTRRRG